MQYALVKLDRAVPELAPGLTYAVPEHLHDKVSLGSFVSVPLRQDKAKGIIVELFNAPPPFAVRPFTTLLDDDFGPALNEEQLALTDWLSTHYLTAWANAMGVVFPPVARAKVRRSLYLGLPATADEEQMLSERQRAIMEYCRSPHSKPSFELVVKHFGVAARADLRQLLSVGYLTLTEVQKKAPALRSLGFRKIEGATYSGRGKINSFWKRLDDEEDCNFSIERVREWPEYQPQYVRKLQEALCIEPWPLEEEADRSAPLTLTLAQAVAKQHVQSEFQKPDARPVLLHGVTGSGKTEIYLQLIADTLGEGKSALVLVPEITLTVQLMDRFRSRFGDDVAVMHSALGNTERAMAWQRVRGGQAHVVIGARSAVFAPLDHIGLIILDEEHEQSYKSEEDPKYHAREVAEWRAQYHNARLLYGSATPAVESYYHASKGDYVLVSVPERVHARPMAHIDVVDMREELAAGNRSIFSRELFQHLGEVVERREQAVLFHNRRGYRRMALCRSCGGVMECPECQLPLVEHVQPEGQPAHLRCHICGYEREMPPQCPFCGSRYFRFFGIGTEKIEEECRKAFPEARVLRLDADSASRKGSKAAIVRSFSHRQAEILVGTQMVAKGLDFPSVTLVGVISADSLLRSPDFRSAERTFALLTQVSGRAGRGELPGRVIIQSYVPDHPLVQAVQDQDYAAFYRTEIARREQRLEPPFVTLACLVASSENPHDAFGYLHLLARDLESHIEVRGPQAARLYRSAGRYRYQLIFKADLRQVLVETIEEALKRLLAPESVHISLTLDPLSL